MLLFGLALFMKLFVTKQEGTDVKSLQVGEELVRKPGTGRVN